MYVLNRVHKYHARKSKLTYLFAGWLGLGGVTMGRTTHTRYVTRVRRPADIGTSLFKGCKRGLWRPAIGEYTDKVQSDIWKLAVGGTP